VKELAAMAAGEFASLGGGNAGVRVRVFCQNDGECSRLRELIVEFAPLASDGIGIESRYLHRRFIWGARPAETAAGPEGPIVAVPYHEMLHRFERRRGRAARAAGRGGEAGIRTGRAMDVFLGFGVGDYVVHRDHGIAIFRGLMVTRLREVKRAEKIVL